jgi:hypothetical protein
MCAACQVLVSLAASAVGGYFAQKAGQLIGKNIYDQYANSIDLVRACPHSGASN